MKDPSNSVRQYWSTQSILLAVKNPKQCYWSCFKTVEDIFLDDIFLTLHKTIEQFFWWMVATATHVPA